MAAPRGARALIASAVPRVTVPFLLLATLLAPVRAWAWDAKTHRLITRLAIEALPRSALRDAMLANERAVEQHTEDPDTVLRRRFGLAEERRHYINLEYFGRDPFAALSPDYTVMRSRFSSRTLRKAGSLPWTIAQVSDDLARAWQNGSCADVMRQSGYLAHYVGDASQPLHTTKHFDGYRGDEGVHSRFEGVADHGVAEIGKLAAPGVHIEALDSPWTAAIAEIRDSYAHVNDVIGADRAARRVASQGAEYDRAMLASEEPLIARQVARSASVLASIWLLEWKRAGSPAVCARSARRHQALEARTGTDRPCNVKLKYHGGLVYAAPGWSCAADAAFGAALGERNHG
jgi:hypothetical protein